MAHKFANFVKVALVGYFLVGASSCKPRVEDLAYGALASGNATMVFGGCSRPIAMGYEVCQLRKGQDLPVLQLAFFNPGEWAVSDCKGGFYKSGVANKPGTVEVDLSGLKSEASKYGVCWLRVETTERYPDAKDTSQRRSVPIAGGFIIEFLADGYNPSLPDDSAAWCYEIRRSTKGRTSVRSCD